ncbi:MAG: cysteine peptidase family C39 domain-containing protein [Bacilli bacterium]
MKFCKQIFQDDCGFACLKMILAYYKKNNRLLNLPNPKLHDKYSFLDLTNLARKYGIELEGYKVDNITLLNKHLPLIVEMNIEGANHFCILYRIKGNIFYIYDPAKGKVKYQIDTFEKLFLDKILIYKSLIDNKKIEINNKINNIFISYITIIILINFSCSFLLFSNMKLNVSNFIGLLLFVCLIFIINKIVLSFFDLLYEKKINEKIVLNEKINLNKNMNEIYFLKQNIFQYISSFIGDLVIIFFIITICTISNKFLIVFFLILGILNFIKFSINKKSTMSKVEHLENELKNNKTKRKENYTRFNKYMNGIKSKIVFIDSLLIIFEFIYIILLQFIDNTFVSNHVLYYFFCFNLFSDKIFEIFSFISKKEEICKDINKVNSLLEYH